MISTAKGWGNGVSQHRNYPFSSFLAILFINAGTVETFVFSELLLNNNVVKKFYCLELRRG